MTHATIKDIAKEVGVSHPTVSKALNQMPGVSEETREKIFAAAKKLNYVPNSAAKRLAKQKNRSIGFIWPADKGLFLYHLCTKLQEEAKKRNIDVLISLSEPAEALKNFQNHFIDFVFSWFLPEWRPDEKFLHEFKLYQGELMLVGGGKLNGTHQLVIERAKGISNAVNYLARRGHKKVAFFGLDSEKKTGYLSGMLENKMEYHDNYLSLVEKDYYADRSGYEAELKEKLSALWFSQNRPTALILDSQNLAIGFLNVFRKLHISIPEDLSVITYDDIPEYSMYPVGLTTCSPSCAEMVDFILQTFEAWYSGDGQGKLADKTLVPQLTVRESVKLINNE